MAVTHAATYVRRRDQGLKLRPISSNLRIKPTRATAIAVTADRRAGVGRPTIDALIPALDRLAHDEPGDTTSIDATPLPTTALVREAIDTALDSIDALEQQARETAHRFRHQAIADAQLGLAHMVESTRTLLQLAVITAEASGTDFETVCEAHDIAAEQLTQTALSRMIDRQLELDWDSLARVIEQPFMAALSGWRDLFVALAGGPGPYGDAA